MGLWGKTHGADPLIQTMAFGPQRPALAGLCCVIDLAEGRVTIRSMWTPKDHEPIDAPAKVPRVIAIAKFEIGMQVRHRKYGFRGVIFDVDPVFNNTEEWWESIPEDVRPKKEQPYYHLLAETPEPERSPYIAYVSEQNLIAEDGDEEPISHPDLDEFFIGQEEDGRFVPRAKAN
jgi:heat shock protein HspQ